MATSLVKVLVHLVFSTKKRAPLIDAALREDLYPYMSGIVRQTGGVLHALGGMPDHVHVLMRLKADIRLSDQVRALKAGSSKWLHERPHPIPEFAWQTGYAAFSVSQSPCVRIDVAPIEPCNWGRRMRDRVGTIWTELQEPSGSSVVAAGECFVGRGGA